MKRDPRTIAITVSLAASGLMLAGKLTAYFLTHSDAIMSDAAESVVHGVATGMAAFSLWLAGRPGDRSHLYGHGKIAYFSAGFEGAMILSAAIVIVWSAVESLVHGPRLRDLGAGLAITAGLALFNLFLGVGLIRVGRRHNALVLVANGKHVLTDMWTSAAVVAGVAVVWATEILWLDPAVAIFAALNILYSAVKLIRESFGGLMDRADPATTDMLTHALENARHTGLISGFHQLRHRASNDQVWIEVHLLLDGSLSTRQAHANVTMIEDYIRQALPGRQVFITTHVEPADHRSAHPAGHLRTDPLE
ncbi:MAG: Ferrous-iron efflux pump FieF [Phycisphaerae bacterium]|nr:Ferrous-iron efflux pump FieF [Phycisphaerae bacterium]